MATMKLRIEATAPFNGLPLIVAQEEGLFAAEGLEVEFMPVENPLQTDLALTDANDVSSTGGMHGGLFEQGTADLYNACEWGNYRRSSDSTHGARQIGRRAAVALGAIVVPPGSDIYTAQGLANKSIAAPFHHGTHYLALQLLEGFLRREEINLVSSGGRVERYRSMMNGTTDAATLTEPWITVAQKAGCRVILQGFYYGTDVASEAVDAKTTEAFQRAVSKAVERINADTRSYIHYFIDYDWYTTPPEPGKVPPEVAALTVADFDVARMKFREPAPVPEVDFQRTYEWMRSWNLIEGGRDMGDLVDNRVAGPSSPTGARRI